MALIDECHNIAFRRKILRKVFQQFFSVLVNIRLTSGIMPVLVNQRTDDGILVFIQYGTQIRTAFGSANLFIHINEETLNLVIQLITVCNNNNTAVRDIFDNPLGKPYHNE